eukprot:CAMPEP_0113699000 /NCGR_PEP_ID=MMETSP0038_2-20120614/23047_1 /TAXON_ID=2898 /ORGANISM="Cryptomonas paramecium" /LENGTH=309 /DNA_ID=CAMNT_0000622275 /DNA_START=141 /DNA_END=1066 /DNA_ORIENTATION=+ /assembly_acc=CAM_ASM_000170
MFSLLDSEFVQADLNFDLKSVHLFTVFMRNKLRRAGASQGFVLCAQKGSSLHVTKCAFLLGAYMLIVRQVSIENILSSLNSIKEHLVNIPGCPYQDIITVQDYLQALHHMRSSQWISFDDDLDKSNETTLDIEEYNHYSSTANGSIHAIVPGRIMVMPSPKQLPDTAAWVDVDGVRNFGAEFFADLLSSEFNASVVLRINDDDSLPEYDELAFDDHGVGFENLSLTSTRLHADLLRVTDRVLSLIRVAPGPVVLHAGGSSVNPYLSIVLCTCLMRLFGMATSHAAAWLSMACPPLSGAPRGPHAAGASG